MEMGCFKVNLGAPEREYWASGNGLGNITPRGTAWPEGPHFEPFLTGIIGDRRVFEFGCGVGRLAGMFDPDQYAGTDICREALEMAQKEHPRHVFYLDDERALPAADILLAHTVLLHIPDAALLATIERFTHPRVIVSEIMDRSRRTKGLPPTFNRDPEEYIGVFRDGGFTVARQWSIDYPYYPDEQLRVQEFKRC